MDKKVAATLGTFNFEKGILNASKLSCYETHGLFANKMRLI